MVSVSLLPNHMLAIFGLLIICECTISLQLLELRVPAHVPLGVRAALSCRWQLGALDVLYSVKWYKDGKEFFRFVPRDHEQRRRFPLPGVDVEENDFTGGNLTLAPAELETAGRYRCEVSGERPLFPTVSQHADMIVVVLPVSGPVISDLLPRYRPGDNISVKCTSGPSYPATRLAWYINGEPASPDAVAPPLYEELGGLHRTVLKLNFTVTEDHFKNNGLKVKCLATLTPLYWRSNEESTAKDRTVHSKLLQASPGAASVGDRLTRADRVLASRGETLSSSHSSVCGLLLISYNYMILFV